MATAAEVQAADSEDTSPVSAAPLSRRAARERLTTAEVFVAATAVAAATAASESTDLEVADSDAAAPGEVVESEDTPAAAAPPAAEQLAAEQAAAEASVPDAADFDADPFTTASRVFRSVATGPTPTASAEEPVAEPETAPADEAPAATHVARRRPPVRKFLAVGATVGVMSLAGLLAVGMTLPAEAVAAVQGGQPLSATSLVAASGAGATGGKSDEIQAFVTSSDVQNESLARSDSFSTMSLVEVASEEGINYSNEVFTNDPEAAIQWPFKVGVGMSSGFGMRWGRLHEGIDFVPGEGAPIQAVADGVVRIATEQGGAYGVTVYIDHVIDGEVVTSHYSHMQYGSLQVKAGQTVKVGDVVGHTGNTGRSYGAHLHFEIIVNGAKIDPLPWLRENAGRYSY
ncbi:peptidoglycan DD-metalloendopeptidase family protein [Microbacterium hydrocarbonoxydans]|nr:peptidoglycan DD-metalloendopeptidase family protein [Microbacterium hydrocarbonoxydans]MCM3779664.1 peptidoglycan DD-metalloendopeptidase family protein [Microbacterium hydrocarbonoxydans]